MTTLPWYNNSNYLPAFKDSITTYWNQSDARGAKSFTIPVKFIVLLADGETANNIMPQHGLGNGGGKDIIELAPNPTKTTTTIRMIPKEVEPDDSVVREVKIINPVNGLQYETKTSASEIELDVSDFMDGIYYVLVSRDGGTSQAVLVVQKE